MIKGSCFFMVISICFMHTLCTEEQNLYPMLKNFENQIPNCYYLHVKNVSDEMIFFNSNELEKTYFTEKYRNLPTVKSGSERFNMNRFAEKNRIPIALYTLTQEEESLFHENTPYLVQDMLIKCPKNSVIAISESLRQFEPAIKKIFSYEIAENTHFDEYYAYLTVDQRDNMEEGSSMRTPGWHIDGMHRKSKRKKPERISRVYTIVVTDNNENITEYTNQSFPEIVNLDVSRYNTFKAFDYLVDPSSIKSALPSTITYMDAYTVHRSPVVPKCSNPGKRTFLRIQFTPKRFNRKGNTINPYFKDEFVFTNQDFPVLEDPVFLK